MKNIRDGLNIFLEIDPMADVSAEHDTIYANGKLEKDKFYSETLKKLDELNWSFDEELDAWYHFC